MYFIRICKRLRKIISVANEDKLVKLNCVPTKSCSIQEFIYDDDINECFFANISIEFGMNF